MSRTAGEPVTAEGPAPAGSAADRRRWAGLAGAVGGLAGLAVADLTAWLVAPAGAPVPAVGSAVIDLLPGGLVNWGKDTLGTADKPVLLGLIMLAVLAVSAGAGRWELRRPYAGAAVFALVAVLGLVAVASRPPASARSLLPILVGLLAGYLLLRVLIGRLRSWAGAAWPADAALARRAFLGWTAAAGGLAVLAAVAGRTLAAAAGAVADTRARFPLPKPVRADPVPPGAELAVPGLAPYLTPNADFYRIDTALQVPSVNPETWTLRITGLVDREITLSYAELVGRPLVEHVATLTCVSNEVGGDLVGNASWLGYPIRLLLAEAGPRPGADMVLSTSHDGWTAGTPLSALTDPERMALLAVGMNGEPLPIEHGYPVRMVVPGLYGYVSATKWVTELKVTTFADDVGYWTPLGWSARGPVKVSSRIDTPRRSRVDAGPVVIAGVAWAQHTGIERVEVGIDDVWRDADLAAVTGPDTWRQWRYAWNAPPGNHRIAVRATDAAGLVQTAVEAPPAPDGATGWHTITVRVG